MTKFKVGDRVKVKDGYYRGYAPGSEYNIPRDSGVVNTCGEGYICVEYGIGYVHKITPALNPACFELVSPEEAAVKLLIEKGYIITPPPPEPLKGKLRVIITVIGNIVAYPLDQKIPSSAKELAIVDWTEGQGI